MIAMGLDNIRSVLCLGAHADDIEIGCGGTLLRLLDENEDVAVHWVVLSGSGAREAEARQSAERFLSGAQQTSIHVETFPDAFFPWKGEELKNYFNELGRRIAPDVVFTHRLEDRHQDHRTVAELTWNTFRDHLVLEYEIPKYEADLGTPNVYVPLGDAVCDRKLEIISESFPSQRSKRWFSPETFRALLRIRAVEAGSQSQFAEGLYCRKLVI